MWAYRVVTKREVTVGRIEVKCVCVCVRVRVCELMLKENHKVASQ